MTIAGHQHTFAEIMRRHRDPVYRLILGYVGNQEEAVDLVQDCLISAFKNLNRFDQERSFRAWLSRIAINKCRDWSRRRAVRQLINWPATASQAAVVPDPAPPLDEAAEDREELNRILKALAELPRSLKEPLLLQAVECLSQSEVAAVLRISEKTVETRIYRARRKLASLREDGSRSR